MILIKKITRLVHLAPVIVVLATLSCCKKNSEVQCHSKFIFRNNSADTVIIANEIGTTTSFCNLRGEKCSPSKEYVFTAALQCWEKDLDNNLAMDLYAADPNHFNADTCYTRDKIYTLNTILKHYSVSIADLKNNGFILKYP